MSWGIKIAILYLGFVGLIVALAATCFGQNVELESKDYYAKELKFQDQINASTNANALNVPIDYVIRERSVQILLPKEVLSDKISGQIQFIRPSDASKDKTVTLAPDSDGIQMIDPGFIKGLYKMQISFNSLGKNYYKEAVIQFK